MTPADNTQTEGPYRTMSDISTTSDALDLWSNTKRLNAVTAKHDSVERVLGNATTLGMILGFLECDLPLTDLEQLKAYKLGWSKSRYNPTAVCWHWYVNWFPNGLFKPHPPRQE